MKPRKVIDASRFSVQLTSFPALFSVTTIYSRSSNPGHLESRIPVIGHSARSTPSKIKSGKVASRRSCFTLFMSAATSQNSFDQNGTLRAECGFLLHYKKVSNKESIMKQRISGLKILFAFILAQLFWLLVLTQSRPS
jgi:hypothetical protein